MAWRWHQTPSTRPRESLGRATATPSTRVSESRTQDRDGLSISIELMLALAQTTRNGIPAGNRYTRGDGAWGRRLGKVHKC